MTSAPVIDERIHRTTLKAAVAAHEGDLPVYDYGKVPGADGNAGTLPAIYAVLSVERTYVQPRITGLATRSSWRASFRCTGRSANEVGWAIKNVTEAVEGRRLTFGGVESTPLTHDPSNAPEPDSGRHSGLAVWTYTL